jgi:hypothetical protein
LSQFTATSENWLEIRQRIPDFMRHFIEFDGLVWKMPYVQNPGDVPLFIVNRPVLLPLPKFRPLSTMAFATEPPRDPLSYNSDLLISIPAEAIHIACSVFPGAKMFLVFS